MIISSSAIVLSKLKYRDNDLIVKLLVRELGVTSFIVRGGSKKNKTNHFQQLSLLEIEFDFNSKKTYIILKILKINLALRLFIPIIKKWVLLFFYQNFYLKF